MSLTIETLGTRLDLTKLVAGIEPGKPEREYSDGGGLYIVVRRSGVHTWRFKKNGNPPRTIGTYDQHNELVARAIATSFRSLVLDGYSLQDRKPGAAVQVDGAVSPLFEVFARTFLDTKKTFKNPKSRSSWLNTINVTLLALHGKQLHTITDTDLVTILEPIWCVKPTVATDARVRAARIFKHAIAKVPAMKGKANPADADVLGELLPEGQAKRGTVKGNHPSLHFRHLPAFWVKLRDINTMPSKLLQWTILTCVRSNEARKTKFEQIARDLDQDDDGAMTWKFAGKNGRVGIVPVTPMMAQLLDEMCELNRKHGHGTGPDDYVFPGIRRMGMQASCNMTVLLQSPQQPRKPRTLGYDGSSADKPLVTVHGFRSSFKSWCQNKVKNHEDLVSEFCLHHIKGDKVWETYARGDMWLKRKELLETWQDYVTSEERRRAEKIELPLAA